MSDLRNEPVAFQYRGATIEGSAEDIALVQELLSIANENVDQLIADIDGLTRYKIDRTNDVVYDKELCAILDKYRSKK